MEVAVKHLRHSRASSSVAVYFACRNQPVGCCRSIVVVLVGCGPKRVAGKSAARETKWGCREPKLRPQLPHSLFKSGLAPWNSNPFSNTLNNLETPPSRFESHSRLKNRIPHCTLPLQQVSVHDGLNSVNYHSHFWLCQVSSSRAPCELSLWLLSPKLESELTWFNHWHLV